MQNAPALVALYALALLLGGMVFFAAVTTPVAFRRLEREQARHYIRGVFPIYYLWVFATSAIAALALLPRDGQAAAVMAACALLAVWMRQGVMLRIRAADEAGDQATFKRLHRLSVIVNLVQMVMAAGVLAAL
ncbi:DUF4149 domain-containing protein [Roseococcus sp.]|uniref:DUF4149 domain-containing protein n=1 Tax=Roseococcus sp. TaxID=2109646 RepID=UPI003BACBAAC